MIKSEPEPPLYTYCSTYAAFWATAGRDVHIRRSCFLSLASQRALKKVQQNAARACHHHHHQMPPGADALSPISHLPAHPAGEGHHLWDGDRFPFPGAFNSCSCSRWVYFRQRVPQRLSIHQTHSWVTDEWNKEKRKQTRTQTTPTSASERESCLWENFCILCKCIPVDPMVWCAWISNWVTYEWDIGVRELIFRAFSKHVCSKFVHHAAGF